jgi:hypothetical protein
MNHPGFTIFLVFFGISLLDALWGGHWIRALFWVGIGVVFFAMDRARKRRGAKAGDQPPE